MSYNTSISATEKSTRAVQAYALLREMSKQRIQYDVMSYNTSISASEKVSQRAQGLALLRELSIRRIE